jgi:hypothetical protein
LDDWARDNINQGALPKVEWNRMQVAAWARKVVKDFSVESAKILMQQDINGEALLDPPVQSLSELIALLPGIPTAKTKLIWAKIEKMKKSLAEPENKLTYPALSIESQLQNLTLDTLSKYTYLRALVTLICL